MNITQRIRTLLWIVTIIRDNGPIRLSEINKRWVSHNGNSEQPFERNTFRKYKNQIEEIFGLNIEYVHDKGYAISNISPLHKDSMLDCLFEKLHDLEFLSRFRNLRPLIQMENQPQGSQHLKTVGQAMTNHHFIEITYHKFTGEPEYTTIVQPYCIKTVNKRWYLIARKQDEEAIKSFSFDRIVSIQITDKTYTPDPSFTPDEFFKNYYGIYTNGEAEKVVIKSQNERQSKYLRSLPIHHSQKEIEDNLFSYNIAITDDFINELMRYNSNIEVLEPNHLREKIKNRLLEQLEIYK